MKKPIILLICVLTSFHSSGQQANDSPGGEGIKTLFGQGIHISGFGAVDLSFTSLNKSNALIMGGHGGLIIERKFILGFGGYGISTPVRFDGIEPRLPLELRGGYGGLVTGYTFSPMEVFHVSIPLFLGIGSMEVAEADFNFNPNSPVPEDVVENTLMMVLQPGIQMEVNVTRFFRIGMGLSYRFTEGADLPANRIGDKELSGFSGDLSFRFGLF